VPDVLREQHTQVPLAEDQHAIGEFGSEGADEPFGKTVRPRAPRRNPDPADASIGQDGIEGCGGLAGPVADEEPELGDTVVDADHEVADLLGGPSTVGVGDRAEQVHGSVGDPRGRRNMSMRLSVTAQSTGKKSQVSILDAGVRRELSPGRVGVPDRCRRYPRPLENAADHQGSHAVTKLEQLALDSLVGATAPRRLFAAECPAHRRVSRCWGVTLRHMGKHGCGVPKIGHGGDLRRSRLPPLGDDRASCPYA